MSLITYKTEKIKYFLKWDKGLKWGSIETITEGQRRSNRTL